MVAAAGLVRRPRLPPVLLSAYVTHALTFLLGISVCATFFMHQRVDDIFSMSDNGIVVSATNFEFPSPEQRLKYYMGDWHDRMLRPEDIACDEIVAVNTIRSDEAVLWGTGQMKQEIKTRGGVDWLVSEYLREAYSVIHNPSKGDENRWLLLHIGDSHSSSTKLPVVSKTRYSKFARSKSTGRHFFRPIIFPLEMNRHYDPVAEYIKLHKEGKVCKWEDKKSTLIWRGALTGVNDNSPKKHLASYVEGGPRVYVVRKYFNARKSDVDIAFQKGSTTLGWEQPDLDPRMITSSDTSMEDQLKHKYILMLEGNDVATGLKWMLASNSVVFMARPTTVSFLMEDMLVPFVHYVPLQDDYSDLIDMVHWARRNDAKCRAIAKQATAYMQRLWMSKRAKRENEEIKRELGNVYARQFGEAAGKCAGAVQRSYTAW